MLPVVLSPLSRQLTKAKQAHMYRLRKLQKRSIPGLLVSVPHLRLLVQHKALPERNREGLVECKKEVGRTAFLKALPTPRSPKTNLHQLLIQFDLFFPEAFVFQMGGFQLPLQGVHLTDL